MAAVSVQPLRWNKQHLTCWKKANSPACEKLQGVFKRINHLAKAATMRIGSAPMDGPIVHQDDPKGNRTGIQPKCLFRSDLVGVALQPFDHTRLSITLQKTSNITSARKQRATLLARDTRIEPSHSTFLIKQDADRRATKFTSQPRVQSFLEHRSGGRFACTTRNAGSS